MADDLVTATWTLRDAVDGLSRALAQLAAGDPDGRDVVKQELKNAEYFRNYYRDVAGADFGEIDRVIAQAKRAVAIVSVDSGGVRVGSVRVPWIGVIGGVVILGTAIGLAFTVRKRRRARAAA